MLDFKTGKNSYLNFYSLSIRSLVLIVTLLINIIVAAEVYEDSDTVPFEDEITNIQALTPESAVGSLGKSVNNLKYPKYQVEIIVFSNLNTKSVMTNKEVFPQHPVKLNKKNSVEFGNSKIQFLLKEYSALQKKSGYKIILQAASQYDLLPSQKSKKFLIQSNQEISDNELNGLENFIGTLIITPIRNNTFNLAFEGIYSNFRLVKAAKVKPKEIHYFDHPMFGVLVAIFEIKMGSASL